MTTTHDDAMLERPARVRLGRGNHRAPGKAQPAIVGCLMEITAWLAGERWSNNPRCVPDDMVTFAHVWADALARRCPDLLPDLLHYAVPLATLPDAARTPAAAVQRAYLYADFACRVASPACLRAARLEKRAARLECLPAIVDGATASIARTAARAVAAAADNDDCANSSTVDAIDAAADAAAIASYADDYADDVVDEDGYVLGMRYAGASAGAGAVAGAVASADAGALRALHPALCAWFNRVLAAE